MRLLPDRITHRRRHALAVTVLVLLAAPMLLAAFALAGCAAGAMGLLSLVRDVWRQA